MIVGTVGIIWSCDCRAELKAYVGRLSGWRVQACGSFVVDGIMRWYNHWVALWQGNSAKNREDKYAIGAG